MTTYAKIIADSVSKAGHRLTTMEVRCHRFVLAEFNTHRVFSRNSASSRAIPVEKSLDRATSFPAFPISWPCEQPGMQGGMELEGDALQDAIELFEDVHTFTTDTIAEYILKHPDKSTRLHKSVVNRLLEPFMWQTIIVSSTEWSHFFGQRNHKDAQPELRAAAALMKEEYDKSVPKLLHYDEWHLPYIGEDDIAHVRDKYSGIVVADIGLRPSTETLKRMSVARCARVSTLNHDGIKSIEDDLKLYDRLAKAQPPHASPLEHVAKPDPWDSAPGNFRGWMQMRHLELHGY